jgi:energy-coupling factor transporter ATP-binding protein EcfA2
MNDYTIAPDMAGKTTTEAAAFTELVTWSENCPLWQRDALRRLCAQDELAIEDLEILTAMCTGTGPKAVPIAREHVREPTVGGMTITIRSIHDVAHVNALATGERLTFDKTGVTIIYGDNGSGKSGYARVLKRVCRARLAQDENILPNIYSSTAGTPTAVIDFSANGQNSSMTWVLDQPAAPLLSAVSVFDCRTANVHVDQTNDVAYTPLPIKVLASLAQACQQVRQRINTNIRTLQQQTPAAISKPACPAATKVGKLIAQLSGSTKPEIITLLATLSEGEKTRLTVLTADLAADPSRAARQLQATERKIDSLIVSLERLAVGIADDKVETLKSAYCDWKTAEDAARVASSVLFASDPLPDIGSDTWRALWESARAYSQTAAYPGRMFPVTIDDARCVLCQQELGPESADRLNRFEAFVKDESKRQADHARGRYQQVHQAIRGLSMRDADRVSAVALVRDEIGDISLADTLRHALIADLWRLRHILRNHVDHPERTPPAFQPFPLDELRARSSDLRARAKALVAESDSDERKALLAERDELTAREWLAVVKDDVTAEIARRAEIAALQIALKDTATNRITNKSNEVAETLVTNALRAQFMKEVAGLGVAGLAIELRQEKTSYGVPLFRVSLIQKPGARVGEILSEGEHRCVALAAFLAELVTANGHSTLVFDDPVSSLDHKHREAVAERLAQEGQHRQIIVFTHDIAFLFLLNEACHAKQTHVAFRCINRGQEAAGFCYPNPPPNAQPLDKVVEAMQKYLDDRKFHHEHGNQEEWYLTVRSLQEQLRTTWERAVEEAVTPVIRRLANKVDTRGLTKLTAITMDDCNAMRAAYKRCSELLHSTSEVLNPPLPVPVMIQVEIAILRDWIASIRERQGKIPSEG